jgi:STELLO glycosyltransferase-like protein
VSRPHAVVTTIQAPTPSMVRLAGFLAAESMPLVVVGDRKGPARFELSGAELFTLAQQEALPFELARLAPVGHYSRKNLGYLVAISRGAPCLYETDDDNAPLDGWRPRTLRVTGARSARGDRWVNVYQLFSDELVWPRGLPLDRIRGGGAPEVGDAGLAVDAPVQQGLADGAPDVDAIWRLVLDRDVRFRPGAPVALEPGTWCPFNSQTTWWWPEAYPLLYLPSHCSFRMTDIWRSFVAQRCLWAMGRRLVFHGPEVVQERNDHRLTRDFEDEVPGYLGNDAIVARLESLSLPAGAAALPDNVRRCYEELVRGGYVGAAELPLVDAWLRDVAAARRRHQTL